MVQSLLVARCFWLPECSDKRGNLDSPEEKVTEGAEFMRSMIHFFIATVVGLLFTCNVYSVETVSESPCSNDNIPRSTPSSDFRILENGSVVRHLATNLEWKRCAVGRTWDGAQCTGSSLGLTWPEALQFAEAAGDGWRLPNVKELNSILEDCRTGPRINIVVFPGTPFSFHWTSSPDVIGVPENDLVWIISFDNGGVVRQANSASNRARLVRDIQ